MNNSMIYPEVINNFNVYNQANKITGIASEITLPTLSAMTATISGAGILGEYNTALIGHFQSMTQDIPFRIVNREYFDMLRTSKQAEIVLRGSVQCVDAKSGGALSTQGMRVVYRGRPTAFNMGTMRIGDLMNASVTLELTYLLIEMGGTTYLELDKLNSIYKVNGEDLLAEVRNQC